MKIEFDPSKDAANRSKHGLSLADFAGFDSDPVVVIDDRYDYGEDRWIALGRVDGEPRCLVYTVRGQVLRLISYRKASAKELERHEQA